MNVSWKFQTNYTNFFKFIPTAPSGHSINQILRDLNVQNHFQFVFTDGCEHIKGQSIRALPSERGNDRLHHHLCVLLSNLFLTERGNQTQGWRICFGSQDGSFGGDQFSFLDSDHIFRSYCSLSLSTHQYQQIKNINGFLLSTQLVR